MQKLYGNEFQQFNFKSIMISKVIILILIFLTSIFDKWCCSLIISSAASSHDNAWAKRKFGLLLPLIYIYINTWLLLWNISYICARERKYYRKRGLPAEPSSRFRPDASFIRQISLHVCIWIHDVMCKRSKKDEVTKHLNVGWMHEAI